MRITERLFALGLFAALAACGGGPEIRAGEMPPAPTEAELLRSAVLGSGDVLEVRVYQEDQLTGVYRISSDGTFDFPLVGKVEAVGKTPGELAEALTASLKERFLRNPQVSVFVKEYNSKKVFVLGQVGKPGTFQYQERMTVIQAITVAGGFKELADKSRVLLTREIDGRQKKYLVPIEGTQNTVLQPGDVIEVRETWL
jgi:polysaccharide export outer membrane protein